MIALEYLQEFIGPPIESLGSLASCPCSYAVGYTPRPLAWPISMRVLTVLASLLVLPTVGAAADVAGPLEAKFDGCANYARLYVVAADARLRGATA